MTDEERLVGGSRRPDGTLRKERRVRPGFVPQDEQPVYQSVGSLVRCERVP
jgi:partner of Y14 and mago protein